MIFRMSCTALMCVRGAGMNAVVTDFPWRNYEHIIDLGSAYGSAIAVLMGVNPKASGVLFDLPDVIIKARQVRVKDRAFTYARNHGMQRSR